ncbi:MAG: IS21 family transposase [Balneolales bacterium]|nr:IS21 family transposase [Balneolales bacterium]
MAAKPITMNQIRILLQQARSGQSIRQIVRDTGLSRNTVRSYLRQIEQSGHTFAQALALDDVSLSVICKQQDPCTHTHVDARHHSLQQWLRLHGKDLGKNHTTRQLLWEEYRQAHSDGYGYTWFCHHINTYLQQHELTAVLEHKPAQTVMFDFAGDTLCYYDRDTDQPVATQVWVGVLPSTSFMHVKAAHSQRQEEVAELVQDSFMYFGGVPQRALFDNFRSVVKRADRYEPTLPELMESLSVHYQCTFMTTRVRKPRDKASVESAVNVAYKRIYGKLRNQRYYSLTELNEGIAQALEELNDRAFKGKTVCRRELFERYEKPLLATLPSTAMVVRRRAEVKVQRNYHVILGQDMHQYSVPWRYAGKKVRLCWTNQDVEIYAGLNRIAIHQRNPRRFGYTTLKEHMPPSHQSMLEHRGWDGEYFVKKAREIGPATAQAIQRILAAKSFPEQTYKSCLGVLKLADKYTGQRLEGVCVMVEHVPRASYQLIKTMLEKNRDLHHHRADPNQPLTPAHANIRGSHTYQ